MFLKLLIACALVFICHVDALSVLQDPPVLSPFIIRDSNTYLVMVNDTETGIVSVSKNLSIDTAHQRFKELVGNERYERDTKMLHNWSASLNTTHQADLHANTSQSLKLNSFYLHHAQCRRCVGYNLGLLDAASSSSVDTVVDVPDYAPARIMKWCPFAWSTTQSDEEGYCIDADDQCPDSTVDESVLDITKCAKDAARDKRSCELCVMDDHVWRSHQQEAHEMDSYDGECVSHHFLSIVRLMYDPSRRNIDKLEECPDRQQRAKTNN